CKAFLRSPRVAPTGVCTPSISREHHRSRRVPALPLGRCIEGRPLGSNACSLVLQFVSTMTFQPIQPPPGPLLGKEGECLRFSPPFQGGAGGGYTRLIRHRICGQQYLGGRIVSAAVSRGDSRLSTVPRGNRERQCVKTSPVRWGRISSTLPYRAAA